MLMLGSVTPALAYTRSPSGSPIDNPISITVNESDLSGSGFSWLTGPNPLYGAEIEYIGGAVDYYSPCYKASEHPTGFTDIVELPVSDYTKIQIKLWAEDSCQLPVIDTHDLEYAGGATIFIVLGGTPTSTPTPSEYINSSGWTGSLSYAGTLAMIAEPTGAIFNDMLPIAVIVIGVLLGLFLLDFVINRFKKKDE